MSNQASNNQIDDSVGSNQPERVDVVPSVDVFEQEFEAKLEPPLSAEQRAGQLLIEAKDILPRGRKGENKSGNKLVVLENLTSEEKTALIQKAADKNFIILEGTDGKVAICRQRNLEYAKEKNFSLVLPKKEDETPEKTVARANGAEFEQEREKKGTARRVIEGIPKAIQKNLALVNALNRQKNFLENYGIYEDPTRDVLGIRKFMGLYTKSNYKWGQQLQVTTEATEEGVVKLKVDKVINLDEDSETSSNYRKAILKKTGLGESSFEVIKNALFSKNVVRTLGEGIELGLTAAAMIGGGIQMSEFIEKGAKKGVEMVAQGSFTALARALNWGRLPVQNLIKGVNEVRLGERTMREFLATTVLSLPAVFLLLGPGTYLSEGTGIGAGTLARKMGFDVVKSRMTDRAVAWSVRRSLSTFAPVLMYNLAAKAGYFEAFGLNEQEQQTSFRKFREMVSSIRSLVLLAQFQMSIGLFDRFSMVSVRENIAGSWLGQNILGAQPAQNPVLEQLLPQAKGRPGLPTPGKGGKAGEFMGFEETTKSPVEVGEKGNLLDEKLENLKPLEKGPPRGPVPIDDPLKWGIPGGHVRSGVIEEHLIINNGIAPMEVVREGSHFGDINVFADGQNVPMEIVMDGDGHILGFVDQRSPSPQLIPLQDASGAIVPVGPWRHERLGFIPAGDQVYRANLDSDPDSEWIVLRMNNTLSPNDPLQVQYIIDISTPTGAPAPVAGSPIVGTLIYSADGTIPIYGAAGVPLTPGLPPTGLVVLPPGGVSTSAAPLPMPTTAAPALPAGFVGGPAVGAPAAGAPLVPGAVAPGAVSSGYGTTSPGVVSWITGAGSSFENERQTAVFIAQHVLADLNGGVRPEDYGLDSSAFAAMSPTDKEAIALDIARRIVQGQDPSGPTYADVNAGKYFTGGVGTSAIPDTTKLDTLINDFKNGVVTGTEGPMAINYYPGTTNVDPFWDGAVGKLNAATATPGVVGPGALPGFPAAGAGVITPGGGLIGAGGTPIMPAVEVTYTPVVGGAPITVTIMPWDHHNDPAIIAALKASGYETNWQQVRYGDQILYWAENSDDGVNGAIIYGGNGVPLDPNNGLFMSRAFKDGELVMVNGMYFDNQGGNLVEITENEFLKMLNKKDFPWVPLAMVGTAVILGLAGIAGATAVASRSRRNRGGGANNPPNNPPPQNLQQQQQPPQQPPANANLAGGGGLGNAAAAPVVVPPQPISNIGNNTNTDSFNNEMNIQPGAFQITNNVDLTPIADAMNGMSGIMQQMLNIIAQQQPGAGGGGQGTATAAVNPAPNPALGVVVQITPGGGLLIQAPPNAAINLVNALQPLYGQANPNLQPLAGAQAPGGQPATGTPPQAMPNNPVPYIYYQAPGGPVVPWPANIPLPPGVNQVPGPGGQYVPPQTAAGNQATVGNPLGQTQGPSNFTVEQGAPYITIQYPNGQQTLWNSNNPLPNGAHPVGGGIGAGDDYKAPAGLFNYAVDADGKVIEYTVRNKDGAKVWFLLEGQNKEQVMKDWQDRGYDVSFTGGEPINNNNERTEPAPQANPNAVRRIVTDNNGNQVTYTLPNDPTERILWEGQPLPKGVKLNIAPQDGQPQQSQNRSTPRRAPASISGEGEIASQEDVQKARMRRAFDDYDYAYENDIPLPEQFIPKPVPAPLPSVLGHKEPPAPPLKSNRNSEGAEFGDVSKGEAVFAQSQPPASASEEPGEDGSQPKGTAIPEYFNTSERIGQAYGPAAFDEFNDLINQGVSPEEAEKSVEDKYKKPVLVDQEVPPVIEKTTQPTLTDKLIPQRTNGNFEPTLDLVEDEPVQPNNLNSQGVSPTNAETPENPNQSNQTLPDIVLSPDTYVNATGPDGDYYGPYSGLEGRAEYTVTQYTDAAGNTRNYTPPSQVAETAVNNPTAQIPTYNPQIYVVPEFKDPVEGPKPPREVSVFGPGAEQDYLRARKQAADGERARPQTGSGLDQSDRNRIHREVMPRIRDKASLLELAGSNYRTFSGMSPSDQESWLEQAYEVEGVKLRFGENKEQALARMRTILMLGT